MLDFEHLYWWGKGLRELILDPTCACWCRFYQIWHDKPYLEGEEFGRVSWPHLGTWNHHQFSSAALRLFLKLDLKLFNSLRLSLNTDPTCRQHLWSYDHMALSKFKYYYYYYYYYYYIGGYIICWGYVLSKWTSSFAFVLSLLVTECLHSTATETAAATSTSTVTSGFV